MTALPSGQLHLIPACRQLCQNNSPVVTLNFDTAVPDRTTSPTAVFEQFRDIFQANFGERNTAYHCNGLAAATFALTPDPDNAVTCRLTLLRAADAGI